MAKPNTWTSVIRAHQQAAKAAKGVSNTMPAPKETAVRAYRALAEVSLHLLPEELRLLLFRNRVRVTYSDEESDLADEEWLQDNTRGFFMFFDESSPDDSVVIGFEHEEDMVAFTLHASG